MYPEACGCGFVKAVEAVKRSSWLPWPVAWAWEDSGEVASPHSPMQACHDSLGRTSCPKEVRLEGEEVVSCCCFQAYTLLLPSRQSNVLPPNIRRIAVSVLTRRKFNVGMDSIWVHVLMLLCESNNKR